jgi:hypothetical protein
VICLTISSESLFTTRLAIDALHVELRYYPTEGRDHRDVFRFVVGGRWQELALLEKYRVFVIENDESARCWTGITPSAAVSEKWLDALTVPTLTVIIQPIL